jgi:hypothetical protein
LWGDLINSLAASPDFLDNLFRPWQPQPTPATTNGTSATGGKTLAIEVVSSQPTQVILDLQPHAELFSLATYGLRAVDPQKPPLTDLVFEPSSNNGHLCLHIRIPDGQPPDIYTGVIVDTQTNLPRGTLSIRIRT